MELKGGAALGKGKCKFHPAMAMLRTAKIYSFNTCSVDSLLIYCEALECRGCSEKKNEMKSL